MPAPSPLPAYLYKILPDAPPDPLPASLPLSSLDAKDGFIHLSTARQTPGTADRFFSTASTLWVLKIALDRISSNTRWEEGSSDTYAHIYGPMPGGDEVSDVKEFTKGEGGDWLGAMQDSSWLS